MTRITSWDLLALNYKIYSILNDIIPYINIKAFFPYIDKSKMADIPIWHSWIHCFNKKWNCLHMAWKFHLWFIQKNIKYLKKSPCGLAGNCLWAGTQSAACSGFTMEGRGWVVWDHSESFSLKYDFNKEREREREWASSEALTICYVAPLSELAGSGENTGLPSQPHGLLITVLGSACHTCAQFSVEN